MRLLGIDYGESKVGLALGDDETRLASPYKILKNQGWKKLSRDLLLFCQKEKIEKIVVGLPINHQVGRPEQSERVKKFVEQLSGVVKIPIAVQDERFTTSQAKKLSGKANEDDIAASLILQAYLDTMSSRIE